MRYLRKASEICPYRLAGLVADPFGFLDLCFFILTPWLSWPFGGLRLMPRQLPASQGIWRASAYAEYLLDIGVHGACSVVALLEDEDLALQPDELLQVEPLIQLLLCQIPAQQSNKDIGEL